MAKRSKSTLKTQHGAKKKREGCNISAERDRISDLPDAILSHILGKLPTKYAVETSILSTRWKHLFAQIPNPEISIKDSDRLNPDPIFISDAVYRRRKANFIKFMYNLLNVTLHDVPRIKKFHLDLNIDYNYDETNDDSDDDDNHIYEWVSSALRLNVSDLWVSCRSFGRTPESLFCCSSLVDLMLNWEAVIIVPSSVSLPNLKRLYLKDIVFNGDALRRILSGCPVLEELCLFLCKFLDAPTLRIFSPSVKSFKIEYSKKDEKHGLELDMPTLNFLCYDDYIPEHVIVKNLNSLRKVYVNSFPTLEQLESLRQDDNSFMKSVADLVVGCSNVEYLSLTDPTVTVISCYFPLLCPFHKLIELELHCSSVFGWKLLPSLLINAPNLEILVFREGFTSDEGCYKIFVSHITEQMPMWSALNLRKIRFEKFNGEVDEMQLVKYFLKNSKLLRKIEISFSLLCSERLSKAMSKVSALQKRSKKCHIELIFGEEKSDVDRSFGMSSFE